MVLCQEWRSLACSLSLSLYLFFAPYLFSSFSPHLCPTTSPLFLIFPHFKVVQMASPSVCILDFPVSRSMSNNFPYNFLRLWHSIITAENWVAKNACRRHGISISEKGLLTESPTRWPEYLSQFLNFKCNIKDLMIVPWMGTRENNDQELCSLQSSSN